MFSSLSRWVLCALLVVAWASPGLGQTATFSPSPWRDCSGGACDAGQAATFLLWSRQSDNNQCKFVLDLAGQSHLPCDTLIPVVGPQAIDEVGVVNGVKRFLSTQINSYPLPWGSSSGGFSFVVDPRTGTPVAMTQSLGPFFAERPTTSGKGAWNLSVTYQYSKWQSMDGQPLDSIHFDEYRPASDPTCLPGACLSLRFTSSLELTSRQTVFGVALGASDRVDVAVSVPIVQTEVNGQAFVLSGFHTNTGAGTKGTTVQGSGTSAGLGDVSLRAKVRLGRKTITPPSWQFALSGELRVPSGNADALLGTGHTAVTGTFIGAYARDRLSPHLGKRTELHWNVSYTQAGSGISITNQRHLSQLYPTLSNVGTDQLTADFSVNQPNEIGVRLGADAAVSNRLTLTGDMIQRTFLSTARLTDETFTNEEGRLLSQPFLTPVDWATSRLFAGGAKFLLTRGWVLTGYVLVNATDVGPKAGVTPVIAIERQTLAK